MERTFSYINDERIGELISSAKRYAIYAAPSISKSTAQALVSCCQQNSGLKTHIVLDVDAEPMRLGFGDREGLQFLFEHGVVIRKATGLRVGVIVVDDEAGSMLQPLRSFSTSPTKHLATRSR
ncbi:MAG: hypothetical protein UZ17_ACD001001003 [Acidobacteria bacterium OLB17]|nr:MAG: hypothetical protein UZ17_ACD001001003 [Acidobacteria bacterium OLB17]